MIFLRISEMYDPYVFTKVIMKTNFNHIQCRSFPKVLLSQGEAADYIHTKASTFTFNLKNMAVKLKFIFRPLPNNCELV